MSRPRVLLIVAGAALIGYGALGLLTADRGPAALRYLGFVVAGVLGHDLLLAPVALAVGALVARRSPAGLRGPLLAGMFTSLAVALIALPLLLGYGARTDDPSALPLDYRRGLVITLTAVWAGVSAVGLSRWAWRRPRRARESGADPVS